MFTASLRLLLSETRWPHSERACTCCNYADARVLPFPAVVWAHGRTPTLIHLTVSTRWDIQWYTLTFECRHMLRQQWVIDSLHLQHVQTPPQCSHHISESRHSRYRIAVAGRILNLPFWETFRHFHKITGLTPLLLTSTRGLIIIGVFTAQEQLRLCCAVAGEGCG